MYVCMLVHVRGVCARVRVYFFLQFTTRVFNSRFSPHPPFLFLEFLYSVWVWCVFGVSTLLMDGDY
jgi:hypothetical protein